MDGASYQRAYGNIFKTLFWIIGILAVVAVVGLIGWIATAKKQSAPADTGVIEGDLQSPIYTTFTTPDLEGKGRSETVSAVIVVVIMPKSLKKFVWLQDREVYDRKYEAVIKAGGKARVTYAPGADFQGLTWDGIVIDIVPAR